LRSEANAPRVGLLNVVAAQGGFGP